MKTKEEIKALYVEWIVSRRELIQSPEIRDHQILFPQNAGNIFFNNMMLGMMAWRDGNNPTALFTEALDDLVMYRDDLHSRGMTSSKLPLSTATILATLLDRQSEFELGPCDLDVCGDLFLDCHLAKRLQGLANSGVVREGLEQLQKAKRHALAIRTYETYFRLIDLDPLSDETGRDVKIAETNYVARRKDPYYSGGPDINGGGFDNEFLIDFRLATILKFRGFDCNSIHSWRW